MMTMQAPLVRATLCCSLLAASASLPLAVQARPAPPAAPTPVLEGLTTRPVRPARRPVRELVYDLAERRVVHHGAPHKRATGVFCYVNTDTVGFYTSPDPGHEYIDWGILGGTQTTTCLGLSDIVSDFSFAYATSSLDTSLGGPGAALTLTFYTGWQGQGTDSGNCPVASFAFSGLPGFSGTSTGIGSVYSFTVDVSGGNEFCMPDGRFGYGYRGDGKTGPLLCLTGDGAGGPEPLTGNEDDFEEWVPDTKGVFIPHFISQPMGFLSWYGTIARADLSGTPAQLVLRDGGGTNKPGSLNASGAALGTTMDLSLVGHPGYLQGLLFAFDTPGSFALAGGQVLLCTDGGGSGELLSGAGLLGTPAGTVGGCPRWQASVPLPKNLDFCGFSLCLQGLTAFGVTPFALSSALDVTLGG